MAKYRVICKHYDNMDEGTMFNAPFGLDFLDFAADGNEVYEANGDNAQRIEDYLSDHSSVISFERLDPHGGARPGAGRKRDPESFDQRSYNAGYQAGMRAKR